MRVKSKVLASLMVLMVSLPTASVAKNHVIEMLDSDDTGTMVFSPLYLEVEPGDSVTFKPVHRTHYVKAIFVPDGAEKFVSKEDEEVTFTLDEEGIYYYVCPPHMMMAMMGVIQVGSDEAVASQVPGAIKAVEGLRGRMIMNADRADELINAIKGQGR